jgi:basic membrane protein A
MTRKPIWSLSAAVVLLGMGTTPSFAEPAVVYDMGTKYDHSFNEAVYNGAKSWVAKNGGSFAEFEVNNDTQREQAIRTEAEAGRDPIIVVGFAFEDALSAVSAEFPKSHFVLLDDELDKPNVQSVVFKAEEGSYLVGMLAAMATKTGVIGFVGGMDIPLIRSYSCGYKQGAHLINPSIKVVENMTGTTPEAWNDPTKGGELARSQFDRGADVVYAAAGGTGVGVLQAAADAKKLSIGVDSNQNGLHPGSVLTSMVNRLDVATYDAFDDAKKGVWKPGVKVMGLADNGVDWALDDNNKRLVSAQMKVKIDDGRQQIISGKVNVVDYVKTNSCPY